MTTLPPVDSSYGKLIDVFFNGLDTSDQSKLWLQFKIANGYSVDPTDDNTEALSKFVSFVSTNYNNAQVQLSPNEVMRRQLMFRVFDLILIMLKAFSQNYAEAQGLLIFYGKWQQQYTEAISKIPLYIGGTSTTFTFPTDTTLPLDEASKQFTFGYGGVNLEDIGNFMAAQYKIDTSNVPAESGIVHIVPTGQVVSNDPVGAFVLNGQEVYGLIHGEDSEGNDYTQYSVVRYAFVPPSGAGTGGYVEAREYKITLSIEDATPNPLVEIYTVLGDSAQHSNRTSGRIGTDDQYIDYEITGSKIPINSNAGAYSIPNVTPPLTVEQKATVAEMYQKAFNDAFQIIYARLIQRYGGDATLIPKGVYPTNPSRYTRYGYPAGISDEDRAAVDQDYANRAAANQKNLQYLSALKSKRQTVADRSDAAQTAVESSAAARQGQLSVFKAMMQTLRSMLNGIFQ